MAEDTEYKKLPVEERCLHKLWKARVDGYEEAAKLFREIDDEKSNEWMKFVNLIKKMVIDTNAMAQERGLETALIFVENCGFAGRTVGDVMSGIVQKCIAAPKTKTKEIAVQISLMYIEIERQDAVIDELIKGMEHKNPKIVAGCVAITTLALKEFGSKIINIKPLIKKLAPLMSDRDKCVREEGKQLAIEIYRWIGSIMKQQISTLPQVIVKELEDEFDKLKSEKAEPKRYLRSQQEKLQQLTVDLSNNNDSGGNDIDTYMGSEEIDPMSLLDPVDILSKLPKDFYEKLDEKKWSIRKEALEFLEKLLMENPKLESGDYGTLVNALRKIITKDTNVVLVAMGGKCLAMIAKGLGKRFSPYAMSCIPSLLEKFKEKKTNVVIALREAIDAIYPCTILDAMQDYIVESLNNKNPNVKSETAAFLARAFARTQPTSINKKLLKLLITALIKTLNESDPTVRDSSAEALGTLLKLMGDKQVGPFLLDVDALKMAKIKECEEKAEIRIRIIGIKKDRPTTAPTNRQSTNNNAQSRGSNTVHKPMSRPLTAGCKTKPNVKKKSGNSDSVGEAVKSTKIEFERELSTDEVHIKSEELLTMKDLLSLEDSNWKNRLVAVENIYQQIAEFDPKTPHISQILVRTISGHKPGLKEMNFQVLKIKLDIIRLIADTYSITSTTIDFVINEIIEKLGDMKNGSTASDVLTAFAEATNLDYIVNKVLLFAFEQKSPKIQSEALNWINKSIMEFGLQLNSKQLIGELRKAVQISNPMVRSSAIGLLGTMSMYMGNTLTMIFDNEKPTLKLQIQNEVDKNVGKTPPQPIRGIKKKTIGMMSPHTCEDVDTNYDKDHNHKEMEGVNLADLLPPVDISSLITEILLKEMSDKDWKTRNEGLIKLQSIISDAKIIKSNVGDLTPALAQRLVDSNAKIAQTALSICEQLIIAMGSGCKNHVRILFPGLLHALGDNKTFVRAAALNCINTFGEKGGYKDFFEGDMIIEALKVGSPALKSELWSWLAIHLPELSPKSIPKEELTSMVPLLYAHICDRNADVRKSANEAVLSVMIHLGYDTMVKALDKLKPASKKDIQFALDKARPNLPLKPLSKGKLQSPFQDEGRKVIRGGGVGVVEGNSTLGQQKSTPTKNPNSPMKNIIINASSRKRDDLDSLPLLVINNTKHQRSIDEQKLRVLKWSFTAPREEFIELLREQMITANINKNLIANMFHEDFRYHTKVIEILMEDLSENPKALISNLDLILKWLSLRFYDTNPSVLLKGLEYLHQVFVTLNENQYYLSDHEAGAFLPHLLCKLGDSKDVVRNSVRCVLRQILKSVYTTNKVFTYVMEGLKTKNARQRSECLEELSFLIENYGLSVCQPSQQLALKEIARHISDRDTAVRNAALNCVVQAYFLAGEKIYKLIGQLNDKDLSMLDERIKRAKRPQKKCTDSPNIHKSPRHIQQDSTENDEAVAVNCDELPQLEDREPSYESEKNEAIHSSTDDSDDRATLLMRQATFDQPSATSIITTQQQQQYTLQQNLHQIRQNGPFGLDPNIISEIEKNWVRVDNVEENIEHKQSFDNSLLFEPIKVVPTKEGITYPQDKFDQLLARSRYMQHTPPQSSALHYLYNNNMSPYMSPQQQQVHTNINYYNQTLDNGSNLMELLPKHDPHIIKMIKSISSDNTLKVRAAINELSEIVNSSEKHAVLKDYEEIFIQNVLAQLKNLSQMAINESLVVYQPLLSILFSFFHSKVLGKTLGVVCIKNLMTALLHLMTDQKLITGDDGQYNKVVNGICLKVLDKSNFTNLNCALIRLLRETCPTAGLPKFTDLLMKCIWRNVKTLTERSNELNYNSVLIELHEFMLALPSTWWQNRPSDTPLRTIKTIIHNMAKVKGNSILQHLNQIPTHSELHAYLIKILKNLQKDGSLPASTNSYERITTVKDMMHDKQRITGHVHETMTQIFKLISEKETKQLGLQKLYDFKIKNPEIDVTAFLKGASPNFQKYIDDGMTEIQQKVIHAGEKIGDNRLERNYNQVLSDNDKTKADPEFWMERLNQLRLKANLTPHHSAGGTMLSRCHMVDNKVIDENMSLHTINTQRVAVIKRDKNEMSPNRLQHIQAKLAQIKKENHT